MMRKDFGSHEAFMHILAGLAIVGWDRCKDEDIQICLAVMKPNRKTRKLDINEGWYQFKGKLESCSMCCVHVFCVHMPAVCFVILLSQVGFEKENV